MCSSRPTIVENGLDIPLANTIIIENAERHGLAELYQLRGRVGRSNRRAYAYLLVPQDTELSEVARKRLAALREFSDLGAGFKIAALDLELRGAGNLLGGEQHGHISTVGFDMYLRLLEETVGELKGEERPLEVHSTLNLGLDIRIPAEYIADEHQRLRAYKRIADARDAEQGAAVRAENRGSLRPAAARRRNLGFVRAPQASGRAVRDRSRRSARQRIAGEISPRIEDRSGETDGSRRENEGAQFTPAGVLRLPLTVPPDHAPAVLEYLKHALETLAPDVRPV
jgi:transcription-repair coupling factor (superfamily II helicase)